jgi:hypothetical protein
VEKMASANHARPPCDRLLPLSRSNPAEQPEYEIPLGLTIPADSCLPATTRDGSDVLANCEASKELSIICCDIGRTRAGVETARPKQLKSQVNCLWPRMCFNRGNK